MGFVERSIREILAAERVGRDADRAVPSIFECEFALRNFLMTHEFSAISEAWQAAKRGLIYAVSPRSEGILKMVDTLNRWADSNNLNSWAVEGLLSEDGDNNDNDVA